MEARIRADATSYMERRGILDAHCYFSICKDLLKKPSYESFMKVVSLFIKLSSIQHTSSFSNNPDHRTFMDEILNKMCQHSQSFYSDCIATVSCKTTIAIMYNHASAGGWWNMSRYSEGPILQYYGSFVQQIEESLDFMAPNMNPRETAEVVKVAILARLTRLLSMMAHAANLMYDARSSMLFRERTAIQAYNNCLEQDCTFNELGRLIDQSGLFHIENLTLANPSVASDSELTYLADSLWPGTPPPATTWRRTPPPVPPKTHMSRPVEPALGSGTSPSAAPRATPSAGTIPNASKPKSIFATIRGPPVAKPETVQSGEASRVWTLQSDGKLRSADGTLWSDRSETEARLRQMARDHAEQWGRMDDGLHQRSEEIKSEQKRAESTPTPSPSPRRSSTVDQAYLDAVRSMGLTVETEFVPIPTKPSKPTVADAAPVASKPVMATIVPPSDPHEAFFRKLALVKTALARKIVLKKPQQVSDRQIDEIVGCLFHGKARAASAMYVSLKDQISEAQKDIIRRTCLHKLGGGDGNSSSIDELFSICAALEE